MKKIIREVDEKRAIMQITTSDERWYLKAGRDKITGLPSFNPVPSVTWVCGHYPKGIGFYKWLADKGWDEAEAVKSAAGDKGSMVHLAIEHVLSGQELRIDTELHDKSRSTEQTTAMRTLTYEELLGVKSFLDWRAAMEVEYTIETLATEITVFSEIHSFAGTVDWIVRLTPKAGEGKNPLKLDGPTPFVIDFKTSKQVWTEYEMQVSAYRVALENGENPLPELNENGSETGKILDLSGMRMAILQVGYAGNKNGYKWNDIEDAFDMFKVAQQIWKREVGDNKPGFTQKDFPLVLSAAKKPETINVLEKVAAGESAEEIVAETQPLDEEPAVGGKRKKKAVELDVATEVVDMADAAGADDAEPRG